MRLSLRLLGQELLSFGFDAPGAADGGTFVQLSGPDGPVFVEVDDDEEEDDEPFGFVKKPRR